MQACPSGSLLAEIKNYDLENMNADYYITGQKDEAERRGNL